MSMVASAHFVRFVVALAYPAFEAVTAQPTVLGSRPEMLYRPSPSVVVRWPPTKISAPSRGVGRVGVTADMTPERVKVGWVAATSAVGVVGLLLPQAHIETASPKTTDKRFMGSLSRFGPVGATALRRRRRLWLRPSRPSPFQASYLP